MEVIVKGQPSIEIGFESKVIQVSGKVTVDSALSTTSENPVMNKVVTAELNQKATKTELSALETKVTETDEKLTELSYDLEKEVENLAPIEGILTKAEIDIKGELKDGYYKLDGSGFVGGVNSYLSTDLLRVIPQETLRVKSWVTSSIVAVNCSTAPA